MLTLVAFFAIPAVSLGFLGSITGAQLASLSDQFSSDGSGAGWTAALWLIPVLAVGSILASLWIATSRSAGTGTVKTVALFIAVFDFAAALFLLIGLISLTEEGLGFALSGGAWLTLFGLVSVAGGGVVEYRRVATGGVAGPPDGPR